MGSESGLARAAFFHCLSYNLFTFIRISKIQCTSSLLDKHGMAGSYNSQSTTGYLDQDGRRKLCNPTGDLG